MNIRLIVRRSPKFGSWDRYEGETDSWHKAIRKLATLTELHPDICEVQFIVRPEKS